MKITIIVEGRTEKVFIPQLRSFLVTRLSGRMPTIHPNVYNGRIPKKNKLKKVVENQFYGKASSDHVIALTDVYTGTNPPEFKDADDARSQMRAWVGSDQRFHPHAAQFEFEAWLLPYWNRIQQLAHHNQATPSGNPESINHNNPPARRIADIFSRGGCRNHYSKTRDAPRILQGQDLSVSINQCPELKELVNTILSVCGGQRIP
jgi:hypothetical protein